MTPCCADCANWASCTRPGVLTDEEFTTAKQAV